MLVTYRLDGRIATITMDDGKVNALSLAMLARAQRGARPGRRRPGRGGAARATGRLLGRLRSHGAPGRRAPAVEMVRAGFELAERLLVVPAAGRHRLHRARDRHGRLPAAVGGLPGRRGRSVQAHRQRGGDRADHAVRGGRDPAAAAGAGRASTGRSRSPRRSRRRTRSRPASSTGSSPPPSCTRSRAPWPGDVHTGPRRPRGEQAAGPRARPWRRSGPRSSRRRRRPPR